MEFGSRLGMVAVIVGPESKNQKNLYNLFDSGFGKGSW
ncbi:MAG: hypothetical protein U5Q03_01250 [Bacteroidota bacterium]|nr:hypothetical protein [Bacteroidota bacterium]